MTVTMTARIDCTSKKYYKQFIHCTSGNDMLVTRKTGDSADLVNENLIYMCVRKSKKTEAGCHEATVPSPGSTGLFLCVSGGARTNRAAGVWYCCPCEWYDCVASSATFPQQRQNGCDKLRTQENKRSCKKPPHLHVLFAYVIFT